MHNIQAVMIDGAKKAENWWRKRHAIEKLPGFLLKNAKKRNF
jgi:hypothetical protein